MKLFEDQPSRAHRDRVLQAVTPFLTEPRSTRRFWLWQVVGAGGFAAVIALILKPQAFKSKELHESVAREDVDPEMLQEIALLQDFDLWQNLDLFENWPEEEA